MTPLNNPPSLRYSEAQENQFWGKCEGRKASQIPVDKPNKGEMLIGGLLVSLILILTACHDGPTEHIPKKCEPKPMILDSAGVAGGYTVEVYQCDPGEVP